MATSSKWESRRVDSPARGRRPNGRKAGFTAAISFLTLAHLIPASRRSANRLYATLLIGLIGSMLFGLRRELCSRPLRPPEDFELLAVYS